MSQNKTDVKDLSQALQERRLQSGYDYADLASLLNEIVGGVGEFTANELEAWEKGGCDLKNPRIFALCQFFGIDLSKIIKDIQVKETKGKAR